MIGAKDLAFPKINLLSWYIYLVGATLTMTVLLLGGVDTGWTFYTPYSTSFSNTYVSLTGIGIFVTGFSSILTGLNFIVTVHTMRAGHDVVSPPALYLVYVCDESGDDSRHARNCDYCAARRA
jgi:heme/copper-type cytochrome/quinol oxidase subunit 1